MISNRLVSFQKYLNSYWIKKAEFLKNEKASAT